MEDRDIPLFVCVCVCVDGGTNLIIKCLLAKKVLIILAPLPRSPDLNSSPSPCGEPSFGGLSVT